jgi:hypothetical protein
VVACADPLNYVAIRYLAIGDRLSLCDTTIDLPSSTKVKNKIPAWWHRGE